LLNLSIEYIPLPGREAVHGSAKRLATRAG
jgi:hypothetical protein